ncbi:MAG: hypothetical protein KDK39_05750 [Leptospiraceae bacterium]|nr:hypothetical protein [Leptospiraceae bacterium]
MKNKFFTSWQILFLLLVGILVNSCGDDFSYQKPVQQRIAAIEASINGLNKPEYFKQIGSSGDDVLSLYKVFSLYVSSFKRHGNEKILEFNAFDMSKSWSGTVSVTVLLINNRIDKPDPKKYDQGSEVMSKLLDLGLPDKLYLDFKRTGPEEYKLVAVGYPFLYKWILLYGAMN